MWVFGWGVLFVIIKKRILRDDLGLMNWLEDWYCDFECVCSCIDFWDWYCLVWV